MNGNETKRKRIKPGNRVSLTAANANLVEKLLSQVQEALPNLKLTKFDMVNWIVKVRSANLSKRELAAIERTFFDPVKALEAAILDAKKKQIMGEEIDIETFLNERMPLKQRRSSTRKLPSNLKEGAEAKSSTTSLD